MPYVLAVDGGNTKTIALVAALDGTILGAGRSGCGDIYSSGRDSQGTLKALVHVEYAVMNALQAARIQSTEIGHAVFNMAGADWPEDYVLLHAEMKARGFGQTILIQNDALGVLHAGSSENIGVSIICGTHLAIGSRGPDGQIWHSSFWQIGIGASQHLSGKALTAVVRSELGIEPPTSMKERLLTIFERETVEEVMHFLTAREGYNEQERGRYNDCLTPILLDEADAGDEVANRIVREHGYELGNYALAAARRVGIESTPFALVLAGGVLRHSSPRLADAIIERVHMTSPDIRPMRSRFEPVIGALFTALEATGVNIDEALLGKLSTSIPAASLFETIPLQF